MSLKFSNFKTYPIIDKSTGKQIKFIFTFPPKDNTITKNVEKLYKFVENVEFEFDDQLINLYKFFRNDSSNNKVYYYDYYVSIDKSIDNSNLYFLQNKDFFKPINLIDKYQKKFNFNKISINDDYNTEYSIKVSNSTNPSATVPAPAPVPSLATASKKIITSTTIPLPEKRMNYEPHLIKRQINQTNNYNYVCPALNNRKMFEYKKGDKKGDNKFYITGIDIPLALNDLTLICSILFYNTMYNYKKNLFSKKNETKIFRSLFNDISFVSYPNTKPSDGTTGVSYNFKVNSEQEELAEEEEYMDVAPAAPATGYIEVSPTATGYMDVAAAAPATGYMDVVAAPGQGYMEVLPEAEPAAAPAQGNIDVAALRPAAAAASAARSQYTIEPHYADTTGSLQRSI